MFSPSTRRASCLVACLAFTGWVPAAETATAVEPAAPAPAAPAAPVAPTPASIPLPPEDPLIQSVVQASNAFAADLLAQLRREPGNFTFAPLGLAQSLLPVMAGLQGKAGDEMRAALHLAATAPEAADGFNALTRRLQRAAGSEANLTVARALWVQQWNAINADYIDLIRQHCRSELRVIDFARPENAVHWINRWIADRTEDRIRAVADTRSFEPHSSLVAVNGVYFNTTWQRAFDASLTEPAPFFLDLPQPPRPTEVAAAPAPAAGQDSVGAPLPTGRAPDTPAAMVPAPTGAPVPPAVPASAEVPMMRQVGLLRTADQADFRLLQLPYRDEALSLVVLLPEAGVALADIETRLTEAHLGECLRRVREAVPARVEVRLPRFRTERTLPRLGEALRSLGMRTVFDREGAADFSIFGVNPDGSPVSLSAINHFVKLSVDEQGATAAATATLASDAAYDAPVELPVAFTVNRPFLYFICDNQTGVLLFVGRVVDPRVG